MTDATPRRLFENARNLNHLKAYHVYSRHSQNLPTLEAAFSNAECRGWDQRHFQQSSGFVVLPKVGVPAQAGRTLRVCG